MVAQRQGYQVIQIIQEIGSATKRNNVDRPDIDQLLKLCRSKTLRKVLVTEFSRLGRQRSETPVLMEAITGAGVSIYAHNGSGHPVRLGNANGKRNSVAGIVTAVMVEPGGRCHRCYGNRTTFGRVAGANVFYPVWNRPAGTGNAWDVRRARR